MDALNLSIQPVGALAVDTASVGMLALTADALILALDTAPVGSLDLSTAAGFLNISNTPVGVIDVPNFLLVKDGLLDEYSNFLTDENGDNLVWQ